MSALGGGRPIRSPPILGLRSCPYSASMLSEKDRSKLAREPVIWMTTVRDDGQPQSSVVWFLLEDDEILVYSKESIRVTNVAERPKVSMNVNSTEWGGGVLTLECTARIDRSTRPASEHPDYLAKYEDRIRSYNWTPESFSRDYPVPIWMSIDRVRSW